jgi:hypothetical protein
MTRRNGILWSLVLLVLLLPVSSVNAKWVSNGVPVCGLYYDEYIEKIIADGEHGAIIIWQDFRNGGSGWDLYADKIEEDGYIEPCGLPVCVADGPQYQTQAIPDGTGGAIMVWTDYRGITGYGDIYAQRIDGTGTARWTENGMPICTADSEQNGSRIVPDGAGGMIVVWNDYREGQYNIYAQRVNADGDTLWQADGVPVDTSQGDQQSLEAVSDGEGGAIVVWLDTRNTNWDIYGQRIDGGGNLLWGEGGVPICLAGISLGTLKLVATPDGSAIAVWNDVRTGSWEIYAQKIDVDGNTLWLSDGATVCPYSSNKYTPQAAADGSGGVMVVWYDDRDGSNPIYAERVDQDGNPAWSPDGVMVFSTNGANEPSIMADGSGGAYVGLDLYSLDKGYYDIYVKKLDHDGNLLWGPEGSAVCTAQNNQYYPQLCSDDRGGVIVGWIDFRAQSGYAGVYCQRVGLSGLWGYPEPKIVSCGDVPMDQGGYVRITTRASTLDMAGENETPIFGYNVWRMITGGGGGPDMAPASSARVPAVDRAKALALLSDPATATGVRVGGSDAIALGLPEGDWESAGFWFATTDTVYNAAVPTKNDSTEAGAAEETFIVTAHTSMPGLFVASEPMVGCSVDNLAPGGTGGFAGAETASPPGLMLSWSPNAAPDMGKYNVYRGDDALFVPGASSLLGTTEGMTFHDPAWVKAYMYFYKLVAVDQHGNMGPSALLTPDDIKVGTMVASFAASLKQFAIEVSWTLSEVDEGATFRVLRSVLGNEFAELPSAAIVRDGLAFSIVDRGVEPGTTYRYRVNIVSAGGSRQLFETEAISTPAMPLTLNQNHPNPFNPSTTIGYYLPEASVVTLEIYDSSGRLVARLADREQQEKGTHSIGWRGLDTAGRSVSSGVYFYRLTSGKEILSRKMVLLR